MNRISHVSPLRYPGGKTILAPFFESVLREKKLEKVTYVEPYAGGAGAALSLLLRNKVENIVINDLDRGIYSFWKASIFDTKNFISKIKSAPVSIDEWHKQKGVYKNKKASILELGFATFFLNRTNVSGIIEGGPIGGKGQEGKWKIDARFNKEKLIARIKKVSLYGDRIKVTRMDGIKLLEEMGDLKNSLIYLDPPYFTKGKMLYLNSYDQNNHKVLADFLNKKKEWNWVLTYDDVNVIRKLYSERKIEKFPIYYSARLKRLASEIMIYSSSLAD